MRSGQFSAAHILLSPETEILLGRFPLQILLANKWITVFCSCDIGVCIAELISTGILFHIALNTSQPNIAIAVTQRSRFRSDVYSGPFPQRNSTFDEFSLQASGKSPLCFSSPGMIYRKKHKNENKNMTTGIKIQA